jgi:hypothetical protein
MPEGASGRYAQQRRLAINVEDHALDPQHVW